jgi:glycosyltransferase involved in cell wall biosynthesis
MIITFVLPGTSYTKPVGGFRVVYEYANCLAERGHKLNIVHPLFLFPEQVNVKKKIGTPLILGINYLVGLPRVSWFDISPKVNMLIVRSLKEKFVPKGDVIIATAWQTAEWVNRYGRNKGEKFYLIQHYENWSGPEERVRATWKMPFKKIVIAKWLVEKAKEFGEETVAYIPNGIDFKQFRIIVPIEERNPKRMGMVYHKYDWKGPQDGIKALKIVRDKFPEMEVVFFSVCSSGSDVPHWVEFHKNPSPNKLLEIYNACSIAIGSSWYEGWFLPGAEAMACGCAVVSTDCGGIREYAEHEVNALLSPPKDPEALAQNILRLLEDDDLRIRLARAGYDQIQKFTWDKAVMKFEEVLRSI